MAESLESVNTRRASRRPTSSTASWRTSRLRQAGSPPHELIPSHLRLPDNECPRPVAAPGATEELPASAATGAIRADKIRQNPYCEFATAVPAAIGEGARVPSHQQQQTNDYDDENNDCPHVGSQFDERLRQCQTAVRFMAAERPMRVRGTCARVRGRGCFGMAGVARYGEESDREGRAACRQPSLPPPPPPGVPGACREGE